MSAPSHIVRIDSDARRTHGWQARAVVVGKQYVSKFYADAKHGGIEQARAKARRALPGLRLAAALLMRRS